MATNMKSRGDGLASTLFATTLGRITEALNLTEVGGSDGGSLLPLHSAMSGGRVGDMRVFEGAGIQRLVAVSLGVPAIGMDSHMLFAFTRPDCPVPHFTLDSVCVGEYYTFHLDLIPRVDLAENLAYMNAVYGPLTENLEAARRIEGLSRAKLSPQQLAVMSPWMLANRADEAAFAAMSPTVEAYLSHWLGLVRSTTAIDSLDQFDSRRASNRDARWRAAIFSPEVDPVWAQVSRLIGEETAARIRQTLIGGQR